MGPKMAKKWVQKWVKKWVKNGSKMGQFLDHFWKNPKMLDSESLRFWTVFFGQKWVILAYFVQVATCGFWPKIDRKKLIKTADFRCLTFSVFSKSGPKNGSFFGHFWTKNGSKNGPLFWPFFGSFFGPFLDPFLDRFWTTLGSLYLCMSYSRRHLPAYVGGTWK